VTDPPRLQALIVDYGGVLTAPLEQTLQAWYDAEDLEPADVRRVLEEAARPATGPDGQPGVSPVHALERGELDLPEFEQLLADRLRTRAGGRVVADGLLRRMLGGFGEQSEMIRVVRRARASGLRTGLLSNSWGLDYPREAWPEMFDTVVISGEVGLRKPEPEIYLLTADRLGVSPEHCVFVDDLGPNVRAAEQVGMTGIRHVDPARTIAELATHFRLDLAVA